MASISSVKGNALPEQKEWCVLMNSARVLGKAHYFGGQVMGRLSVVEVNVESTEEDEKNGKRGNVTLISETTVEPDMQNGLATLHGGCAAYLIDVCTSVALSGYYWNDNDWRGAGVSQSLNVIYHAPAPIGTKLRIVSTTVSGGKRAATIRCEIWTSDGRLVASGTHIKMRASAPKL